MAVDADTAADAVNTVDGPQGPNPIEISSAPDTDAVEADDIPAKKPDRRIVHALIVGVIAFAAVAAAAGWLGYRAYQSHQVLQQHALQVQAGRQAALELTTIDYRNVDAQVALIVNSSTGVFRDDFQKRAPGFIDVVKQAQSKSEGTISEAGMESAVGDQAQVLVAVSVKTTTPTDNNPQPRGWRMRISVQQTSDGPKVSNVEFVP
jgi:Mce-associated membrane protein